MKKFINKILSFIKRMLSKDSPESSKRSMGVLIVINTIVIEYICVYLHIEAPEIVNTVFIGGIVLLGVTAFSGVLGKYVNKKKTK